MNGKEAMCMLSSFNIHQKVGANKTSYVLKLKTLFLRRLERGIIEWILAGEVHLENMRTDADCS